MRNVDLAPFLSEVYPILMPTELELLPGAVSGPIPPVLSDSEEAVVNLPNMRYDALSSLQNRTATESGDCSSRGSHFVINQGLRPRKGHRKSRQGCFNCKKRKIKVCAHLTQFMLS